MNLTTRYLGFNLRSPLVVSASPLSRELDDLKRMEDSGAGAIVLYSLFEEQMAPSRLNYEFGSLSGPEAYLDHIAAAKSCVNTPIIASINCTSLGGWTGFAKLIQDAGADALELNICTVPTDPQLTGASVEQAHMDIVRDVRKTITMPLAVKLMPYFTALGNMAARLDSLHPDALVLFNRFYQSDLDTERALVTPPITSRTEADIRFPLHWVGILYGKLRANLAVTSGIHDTADVVKLIMAGADVTMLCSVLMRHGIEHMRSIEADLVIWLEQHQYNTLDEIRGTMSKANQEAPGGTARAEYVRALSAFVPPFETPRVPVTH